MDILNRLRAISVESLQLNLLEDELRASLDCRRLPASIPWRRWPSWRRWKKSFHIVIEPERLELDFIEDLPRLAAYVEARGRRANKE